MRAPEVWEIFRRTAVVQDVAPYEAYMVCLPAGQGLKLIESHLDKASMLLFGVGHKEAPIAFFYCCPGHFNDKGQRYSNGSLATHITEFMGKLDTMEVYAKAPTPGADRFPHKCPRCGSPAYLGFSSIDCSKGCQA